MPALRTVLPIVAGLLSMGGGLGACALIVGPVQGQTLLVAEDASTFDVVSDPPEAGVVAIDADAAQQQQQQPEASIDSGFNGAPITIAAGQGTPMGIVLGPDALYWSNTSDATLRRMPVDDTGTPLADAGVTSIFSFADAGAASASDLMLDGTTLYAVVGPNALTQPTLAKTCRTYFEMPISDPSSATCAKPTNLCNASTSIATRVAYDSKNVFLSNGDCDYILGAPKPGTDGNSWRSLGTLSDQALAMYSDNTSLFFAVGNEILVQPSTPGAGLPTAFVTSPNDVGDIYADGNDVFWASTGVDGSIESLGETAVGGNTRVLAGNQEQPQRLGVDDSNIYWTNTGMTQKGGSIGMAPKNGSAVARVLAGSLGSPWGIAVGTQAIYWTNSSDGTIMMLRR
jgi:hypothetical protein